MFLVVAIASMTVDGHRNRSILAIGSRIAQNSRRGLRRWHDLYASIDSGIVGADGGGGDQTMSITFTSQPVGNVAQYAPTNVVATWIEDSNGTFVQTINRQSGVRSQHLVAWTQKSGGQDADQDALTGATRPNHATPVTAVWAIPAGLADGIYTVRVETCDENSNTAAQNTQGTFTFEKNGTASIQTPVVAGYTNVTIDYSGQL